MMRGWRRSTDRTRLQPNSLQTGNFSGNSRNFDRKGAAGVQETLAPQRLPAEFPVIAIREKISEIRDFGVSIRENQQQMHNCGVSVHFSHTCSAATEHDLFSLSICKWGERDGGREGNVEAPRRSILACAS
jgi:hypothetical protein